MQCAFHPTTFTSVRCHHCGRALCASCDHRIKGLPYCQECIVAGIESLRRLPYGQEWNPVRPQGKSPFVALLFGLFPGLGAAYNGQPIKALCQFVMPVSLWQLADIFHGAPAFIAALTGVALYLYSLYDAWHTAQCSRAGADLVAEDARIKGWLQAKLHIWASLLIAVGGLTLLDQVAPRLAQRSWPVLLILAGLFLLKDRFMRPPTVAAPPTPSSHYQPRPVSFMTTGLNSGTERQPETEPRNIINAANRFDRWG
jgi:hypothetical protein